MEVRLAVAVDLGATNVRVSVGNQEGRLLWRQSKIMPVTDSVEHYVRSLVKFVGAGVSRAKEKGGIVGIGVASMGPLDIRKGCLAGPANIPFKSVPIVGPLKEEFGVDVALMNDANAAALGERTYGAGKGVDDLAYVTISTGIGGGAIVDGHLLVGKDGNAAEIGHVVVDSEGRLTCGCGRKGHWEAYCSGRSLPKFASLLASSERGHGKGAVGRNLKLGGRQDAAAIFEAAKGGNPFARRVVRESGELNAIGVANVVNMYDPSLVTLGGGVALNNQEEVLGPIRRRLPRHAINRPPKVMITPLGDDAGLLGALSLVFTK